MSKRLSSRDLVTLSAYLDGELSQAEATRLESRLESDPGLRSALDALRRTRAVLRRTPQRRAPRNFTLTPRQVAPNPPMPRLYGLLRAASALATVLLLITFAAQFVFPMAAAPRAEPMAAYAVGGAPEGTSPTEPISTPPPLEMEAPAAPEAEAAPFIAEAPSVDQAQEEATAKRADKTEESETPVVTPTQTVSPTPPAEGLSQPPPPPPPTGPASGGTMRIGQIALAVLAALFGLIAFVVRRATLRKWQEKTR